MLHREPRGCVPADMLILRRHTKVFEIALNRGERRGYLLVRGQALIGHVQHYR